MGRPCSCIVLCFCFLHLHGYHGQGLHIVLGNLAASRPESASLNSSAPLSVTSIPGSRRPSGQGIRFYWVLVAVCVEDRFGLEHILFLSLITLMSPSSVPIIIHHPASPWSPCVTPLFSLFRPLYVLHTYKPMHLCFMSHGHDANPHSTQRPNNHDCRGLDRSVGFG